MATRIETPPSLRGVLWRRLFNLGVDRRSGSRLTRLARSVAWGGFLSLLMTQNPEARRRRWRALAQFWRCQLLRARGRWYEVDLGPRGRMVFPPSSAIGPVTGAAGFHEPWEQHFAEAFVRRPEGVIDVGASAGFYAVPLGVAGAHVLAFEPVPDTADLLRENVRRNGIDGRVEVVPVAIGDRVGRDHVTTGLDAMNRLVGDESPPPGSIPVTVDTLDHAMTERPEWFSDHPPVLVKIDVEGHEDAAVRGAARLLERHRPVVMVEVWRHSVALDALGALGYGLYWYDASARELVRMPEGWRGREHFHSNAIAVPGERLGAVEERLREAAAPAAPAPRVRRVQPPTGTVR